MHGVGTNARVRCPWEGPGLPGTGAIVAPDQWFSKCGLLTSIRVPWELVRNASSQALPQTC